MKSTSALPELKRLKNLSNKTVYGGQLKSPLYYSPRLFEFIIGMLHSQERYERIGKLAGKQSVLELGCGTGVLADHVKGNYLGIDLNRKFVEYGKRKGRNLKLGDIQKIKSVKQDVIVLVDILHHLPNYDEFLENMVKTGKKVVVCEPFDTNAVLTPITSLLDRDGVNNSRHKWFFKKGLKQFFKSKGARTLVENGQSITAVFKKKK